MPKFEMNPDTFYDEKKIREMEMVENEIDEGRKPFQDWDIDFNYKKFIKQCRKAEVQVLKNFYILCQIHPFPEFPLNYNDKKISKRIIQRELRRRYKL